MNITTFGIVEEATLKQLENCMTNADYGVLCADNHKGYSQPIGAAIAYENHISPTGVGFDIGCGNKAVKTELYVKNVNIKQLMDKIVNQIGFGIGRPNPKPIDHEIFEKISTFSFKPVRTLVQKAQQQLGTVGSGNHYIDIFEDMSDGKLVIGVHFGSRGFGHTIASGFMAMAAGLKFDDRVKEGEMDSPPVLLDTRTEIGELYIQSMELAGEYAYAGRDTVINKVVEILGSPQVDWEVHNHHNFAWKENHFGKDYWVIRKGCTPAFPGQLGFVGANMQDYSVILEGVDSELSRKSLYSTVHGAGRIMSRSQAKGKTKWKKDDEGRRIEEQIKPGLVDFQQVKSRIQSMGIELRGAAADEAPEVYKSLEEVLNYHGDTIRVITKLKPVGVAMAGSNIVDPYKD